MAFTDVQGVVLDNGTQVTKAGFIGEFFPRAVCPTAVGRYRHPSMMDGCPEVYCGSEAIKLRGLSNITWPMQDGLIKDWDEMEKLWFHIFFKELHIPPEQTKVLHAVNPLISRGDREKMAEIFFESFVVSHLNLVKSPILVLHASGRTTGVVYENGASHSSVSPVYEGFPLMHTTVNCDMTGDALTKYLNKMLSDLGYSFTTAFEIDVINDIKAKLCYVAPNYQEECAKYNASGENQMKYNLPDGQRVLIGEERFKCPEVLFQPSLVNVDCPGVIDYICNNIDKCDIDIRPDLYQNVVLAGGSTLFPGMVDRIQTELYQRIKSIPGFKAGVEDLPSRQNATWIGGSILGAMDCLKGFWMTKQEYEDLGADRVNYKFF